MALLTISGLQNSLENRKKIKVVINFGQEHRQNYQKPRLKLFKK